MFGDLHYPSIDETIPGLKEAHSTFYGRFIDQFLKTDADFYVSIGDLTNYGLESELKDIYGLINQESRTFYHALGNHDLLSMTKKEVLSITGQAQYHSFETEKAVLVLLDTAKEKDPGGWVDNEQLSWLQDVIRSSGIKPMLVFAHHPVYNTTALSNMGKHSIHPDADIWSILAQKEGVGMYFNGHIHVDSIVQQKNWTFVQTSAPLDQHAFRLIEIGENEITVNAIDLNDSAIAQSAPIIYDNISHFAPEESARGTDEHRNCRIPLLQ
nr:metallophosphoesterase [Paenibacillus periandrae]